MDPFENEKQKSRDQSATTFPAVEIVAFSSEDRKAASSTELAGASAKNSTQDSFEQTAQPAKAPNMGIYTSSGKLDARSSVAQALLKAKDQRGRTVGPNNRAK